MPIDEVTRARLEGDASGFVRAAGEVERAVRHPDVLKVAGRPPAPWTRAS